MPSTITSLRATLFLAPALVLTACQPAISLLEMVAERNNALTAAGGERERPAPSKPADDTAALDTQEAQAVALSTDKPLEETAPDEPEARVDAGSGVVYAAPLATATAAPPPTSTPDPFQEAGDPVRLEIPAIQVDAFIELVGLTPQDAMDVPKGWMNAGWYHKGFRPGEAGNAVIAGHLDSSTGGGVHLSPDADRAGQGPTPYGSEAIRERSHARLRSRSSCLISSRAVAAAGRWRPTVARWTGWAWSSGRATTCGWAWGSRARASA